MYTGRTERVHIDSEEDGFHFLVKTEDGDWFDFKITDEEQLHSEIKSYALEMIARGETAHLCAVSN